MPKQLYTCIGFFPAIDGMKPQKFRNCSSIERFRKFAVRRGFIQVNFYFKPPKGSPKGTPGPFYKKEWIPENYPRNKK
jgi:hypothetical protein